MRSSCGSRRLQERLRKRVQEKLAEKAKSRPPHPRRKSGQRDATKESHRRMQGIPEDSQQSLSCTPLIRDDSVTTKNQLWAETRGKAIQREFQPCHSRIFAERDKVRNGTTKKKPETVEEKSSSEPMRESVVELETEDEKCSVKLNATAVELSVCELSKKDKAKVRQLVREYSRMAESKAALQRRCDALQRRNCEVVKEQIKLRSKLRQCFDAVQCYQLKLVSVTQSVAKMVANSTAERTAHKLLSAEDSRHLRDSIDALNAEIATLKDSIAKIGNTRETQTQTEATGKMETMQRCNCQLLVSGWNREPFAPPMASPSEDSGHLDLVCEERSEEFGQRATDRHLVAESIRSPIPHSRVTLEPRFALTPKESTEGRLLDASVCVAMDKPKLHSASGWRSHSLPQLSTLPTFDRRRIERLSQIQRMRCGMHPEKVRTPTSARRFTKPGDGVRQSTQSLIQFLNDI